MEKKKEKSCRSLRGVRILVEVEVEFEVKIEG